MSLWCCRVSTDVPLVLFAPSRPSPGAPRQRHASRPAPPVPCPRPPKARLIRASIAARPPPGRDGLPNYSPFSATEPRIHRTAPLAQARLNSESTAPHPAPGSRHPERQRPPASHRTWRHPPRPRSHPPRGHPPRPAETNSRTDAAVLLRRDVPPLTHSIASNYHYDISLRNSRWMRVAR